MKKILPLKIIGGQTKRMVQTFPVPYDAAKLLG